MLAGGSVVKGTREVRLARWRAARRLRPWRVLETRRSRRKRREQMLRARGMA